MLKRLEVKGVNFIVVVITVNTITVDGTDKVSVTLLDCFIIYNVIRLSNLTELLHF